MMRYITLVFFFGIVNLCLGFFLAMRLHQKPLSWWQSWASLYLVCWGNRENRRGNGENGQECKKEADKSGKVEARRQRSPVPAPAPVKGTVSQSVATEASAASAAAASPAVLALQRLAHDVTEKLSRFSERLQNPDGDQFCSSVWTIVGGLHEICEPYTRRLAEMSGQFLDGSAAGSGAPISDELQGLILEQEAQLETTLSNLQHMDFNAGLSAGIQRVLSETNNNLSISRRLLQAAQANGKATA